MVDISPNGQDEKVVAVSAMKRTRNILKDERLFHPCYTLCAHAAHGLTKKG